MTTSMNTGIDSSVKRNNTLSISPVRSEAMGGNTPHELSWGASRRKTISVTAVAATQMMKARRIWPPRVCASFIKCLYPRLSRLAEPVQGPSMPQSGAGSACLLNSKRAGHIALGRHRAAEAVETAAAWIDALPDVMPRGTRDERELRDHRLVGEARVIRLHVVRLAGDGGAYIQPGLRRVGDRVDREGVRCVGGINRIRCLAVHGDGIAHNTLRARIERVEQGRFAIVILDGDGDDRMGGHDEIRAGPVRHPVLVVALRRDGDAVVYAIREVRLNPARVFVRVAGKRLERYVAVRQGALVHGGGSRVC